MKLSKRQSAMIDEMVLHETRSALKSRDDRHRILGESRRNDILFEAGPDALSVDTSLITDLVEEDEFENLCHEAAAKILSSFRLTALNYVAKAMNQHGMVPHGHTSARELDDEIENFEGGDMVDSEMEVASDIAFALQKYAKGLAQAAVGVFGGNDPRDNFDPEGGPDLE